MSRKTIMPNIAYDTQRRSFYVTLRDSPGQDGAPRRTVRCYPTLERALQALNEHQARRALAQGKVTKGLTVGQWLCYWLETVVRPSRSASTTHGYTMIIRNHLVPALGTIRLDQLTTAQVQDYLNQKQAEGLCCNTVRKHHGVLHNALEHARRRELIVRNVVEQASRPSAQIPVHHYYDSETMARLFELLAGTTMEPVVKLAGYLGLRRSEICGLKWSHVDREAKVITIAEARTAVNGRSVDKETKNRSSVRRLGYRGLADLDEVIEGLWRKRERDMRRFGDDYVDRGFVLCHGGGQISIHIPWDHHQAERLVPSDQCQQYRLAAAVCPAL